MKSSPIWYHSKLEHFLCSLNEGTSIYLVDKLEMKIIKIKQKKNNEEIVATAKHLSQKKSKEKNKKQERIRLILKIYHVNVNANAFKIKLN